MKKIAMAVFVAMVIASCAKEEKSESAEQEQITLSATFSTSPSTEIKPEHQIESRATATAFESGDELGLFVVKSGMEVQKDGNLVNNHKMVVGSDGVIKGAPTAVYYPTSTSQATSPTSLYSYYPYQSGDATADALGVLVGIRTDQTDFLDVKRSDLCFGSARDIVPSKTAQPITFKHSFAQVRVNVALFAGCPAIKQLRLINVKDSALLNIQTGAISLKQHTAEVLAYKSAENSYSTIIPAQTLNGACVAIDLVDNKTTYIYNAINPINLTQSATNTLNLTINDKGVASLNGTPSVTAWTTATSSGMMNSAINNQISLYWLAPHSDYATADKIVLTVVDLFNVTREIEAALTLDPTSSAEYAVYTFPLAIAGAGYPMIITQARIYKGATLLRQSPQAAILGATLYRAGSHVMGLNLAIDISPISWLDVAGTGGSTVITVNTIGTTQWRATAVSSTGEGLTVTPSSATTATVVWTTQTAEAAPRTGVVTFQTDPLGATTTLTTSQLVGPAPTLTLSAYGPGVTVPKGGGTYYVNVASNAAWTATTSYGSYVSISPSSGTGNVNSVRITVAATSLSSTRPVNAVFKTNAVPSGATASQTWSGTQESAAPANAVLVGTTWWSLSNTGAACNWDTAQTRCVSPWRLPSYADFENLINSGKISSVTGISAVSCWSSTQHSTDNAWYLYRGGNLFYYAKNGDFYVRCCQ